MLGRGSERAPEQLRTMEVPKKNHDIPRPRLFETAAFHLPFTEITEDLHPASTSLGHARWTLGVQGDRSARCSIPYPVGWRWIAPTTSEVLGTFVPPDLVGPEVSVRMTRLAWEVDPLAFLMHHCHARGLVTTLARPELGYEQSRFELGGTREMDGGRWRSTAILHVGRLLIVETSASAELWNMMRPIFRPCRREFEVLPSPESFAVEPQRSHRTEYIRFCLPSSWMPSVHRRERGYERFVFSAPECSGAIIVDSGTVGPPLQLRQASLFEALESLGRGKPGHLTMQPSGIRTFSGILHGTLEGGGDSCSVRIAHRSLGKTYVDYTTVAPTAEARALDAMRTIKAIEIAIDSTLAHPETDACTTVLHANEGDAGDRAR